MKHFYTLLLVFLSGYCTQAQVTVSKDTARKNGGHEVFTSVETVPEFPGGAQAFGNYLGKNLRYPEVARLIGLNGRLVVSFVVDTNGRVTEATPEIVLERAVKLSNEAIGSVANLEARNPGWQSRKSSILSSYQLHD